VIGMTLVPEVVLAREMGICYVSLAMITDYDCWKDHAVTYEEVAGTMKKNLEKIKQLLGETLPFIGEERKCSCRESLKSAKA